MTIYEQIKDALKNKINELVSPQEVKKTLQEKYGTNPDSIILSDYCYNRFLARGNIVNKDSHLKRLLLSSY